MTAFVCLTNLKKCAEQITWKNREKVEIDRERERKQMKLAFCEKLGLASEGSFCGELQFRLFVFYAT